MGTYNFIVPSKGFWRDPVLWVASRIGHTAVDVLPYVLWGNTPNDKSNLQDRAYGAPAFNTWMDANSWLIKMAAAGVPVSTKK